MRESGTWNEGGSGVETAKRRRNGLTDGWAAIRDSVGTDPEDLRTSGISPPSRTDFSNEREERWLFPKKIPRDGHAFGGQSFS